MHGRPLRDLTGSVTTYDLQLKNVVESRAVVAEEFLSAGMTVAEAETMAQTWVHHGDFLLTPHEIDSADFVVGNPPTFVPRMSAMNGWDCTDRHAAR